MFVLNNKEMNPFLIQNYISAKYFCNRFDEINTLTRNIENQSNTVLFAQRKVGKSAMISHLLSGLDKKKYSCIYLDIYATQNLSELTNQLANSIYQVYDENKKISLKFWESIKLLRPILSINQMSGMPELSLDISKSKQIEQSIPKLLQFIEKQDKKIVIAIDEFQQILEYPETNVEALLRTTIQKLNNVVFIFLGSNQKMMKEIFNDAKRPFYSSSKNLSLPKIEKSDYIKFIKKHFNDSKIEISKETIDYILELTTNHTYFTQRLCHELFSLNYKSIDDSIVMKTLQSILNQNESVYYQYRNMLSSKQWQLLEAIAKEEVLFKPYSTKFIHKYNLGQSASVKRTLESLLSKELIFHHLNLELPYYEVQDKFLMKWFQFKS